MGSGKISIRLSRAMRVALDAQTIKEVGAVGRTGVGMVMRKAIKEYLSRRGWNSTCLEQTDEEFVEAENGNRGS